MDLSIKDITKDYGERVKRISLFEPLYKLQDKRFKDDNGNLVDCFSFGLITLLFFFENMLMRNKKNGVKELGSFFESINEGEVSLNKKGFEELARTIIEVFRPPSGKRNSKTFYNWDTRRSELVQFSILKASMWDNESNTQYYMLDEQGLDLIFATKEYFSEFQISINQLVLRKQLEKGEFVGALRQIDEMRLSVSNLYERIYKIKHEIQRNIISDETYERYKNTVEDINLRLNIESEEFRELREFVRETREKMSYEFKSEKDRKTYELVIEIDKELGEVHYEHSTLLKESIALKTTALQSAQESLYYAGIESFNFNQEVAARFTASPLPLEASRRIINPFLSLEVNNSWSPLSVFSPQRINSNDKNIDKEAYFLDIDEEDIKKELLHLKEDFKRLMELILQVIGDKNKITLGEIVDYIKDNEARFILNNRIFYSFYMILHQKSPINIGEIEEENILSHGLELLKDRYRTLEVIESNTYIKVNDKFTISNMIIKLEE